MAHTYTSLHYHCIFSTRNREPHIDVDLRPKLFPYMGGIVRSIGGSALLINGVADHVHMLMSLPARLTMADAMRLIKTNSSKWIHEQSPARSSFSWQTGYGAFSVSKSTVNDVSAYIANQEQHHQKMTFKEEFIAFLKRHELEYDERYIWE